MAVILPIVLTRTLKVCLPLQQSQMRLWLQDGDPSQKSAMARAAMDRANCELLKIPPRSPNLNPIENIFKLVSDALRKQQSYAK